mmetsp:Transcript_12543/g.33150  ORF Transcript_12543/g.33150 Transcript_12543/m.33150 type:complete len:253 (+) Transcript_12543:288-1046(+)
MRQRSRKRRKVCSLTRRPGKLRALLPLHIWSAQCGVTCCAQKTLWTESLSTSTSTWGQCLDPNMYALEYVCLCPLLSPRKWRLLALRWPPICQPSSCPTTQSSLPPMKAQHSRWLTPHTCTPSPTALVRCPGAVVWPAACTTCSSNRRCMQTTTAIKTSNTSHPSAAMLPAACITCSSNRRCMQTTTTTTIKTSNTSNPSAAMSPAVCITCCSNRCCIQTTTNIKAFHTTNTSTRSSSSSRAWGKAGGNQGE